MAAHVRLGHLAALPPGCRESRLMGPVPERPVRSDLEEVDERGAEQPRHLIEALSLSLFDESDQALALAVEPLDRTPRNGFDHSVLGRLPLRHRLTWDDRDTDVQPLGGLLRAGQIHLQDPFERGGAVGGAVLLRKALTRKQQQQIMKTIPRLASITGTTLEKLPSRQLFEQLGSLPHILIKKGGRGQRPYILRLQHGQ